MRSASPNPSFSGDSTNQSQNDASHKSDPASNHRMTDATTASAAGKEGTSACAASPTATANASPATATGLTNPLSSTTSSEANHTAGGSSNNTATPSTSSATPSASNAHKVADNLQSIINAKNLNEKIDKTDIESFLKDWRHFECKTWHLEPTVRLLSWAGKSIEPYGIDYILNKLGFSHARTTIPKWLQRGFMDPLDKLEALLIVQLLFMVRDDRNNQTNQNR